MSIPELFNWCLLSIFILWPLAILDRACAIFSAALDLFLVIGILSGVLNSTMLPSAANLMLIFIGVVLLLRLVFTYLDEDYAAPGILSLLRGLIGKAVCIALMVLLYLNIVTIGMDRGMEQTGAAGMVAAMLSVNDSDTFVLTLMGICGVTGSIVDTIVISLLGALGQKRYAAKRRKAASD